MNTIFFLLLLVGSFVITTSGLDCYQCNDERGDKCGDKFNKNGVGVRAVSSTSGYCWKLKAEIGKLKRVARGGDRLQNQHPDLSCPAINTCQTIDNGGIKAAVCCCQNKDFCNTASTIPVTLSILLFSTMFVWIFAHIY